MLALPTSLRVAAAALCLRAAARLPSRARAGLGAAIGELAFRARPEQRARVAENLAAFLPDASARELGRLALRSARARGRSVADLAVTWYASADRVRSFVRVEGLEELQRVRGRPVLLLAPHLLGLEHGGIRLSLDAPFEYAYSAELPRALERLLVERRGRFGTLRGIRGASCARSFARTLRGGGALQLAPDVDPANGRSRYVPFGAGDVAVLDALPRLVQRTNAWIVPYATRQLPAGRGYVVTIEPAWPPEVARDVEACLRRVIAFVERAVRAAPEQYAWTQPRRHRTTRERESERLGPVETLRRSPIAR